MASARTKGSKSPAYLCFSLSEDFERAHLMTMDISQIPETESEYWEFKGSHTKPDKLKNELKIAASAFANTGGGTFVAGLDNKTGKADGGIVTGGRQEPELWVNQVLNEIEPKLPALSTTLMHDVKGRGYLDPSKYLLIVHIPKSPVAPHMGPNNVYYQRIGASSHPMGHYMVEACRLANLQNEPRLCVEACVEWAVPHLVWVDVMSLSQAPAMDVEVIMRSGQLTDTVRAPAITYNRCVEAFTRVHMPEFTVELSYSGQSGHRQREVTTIRLADCRRVMRLQEWEQPHPEVTEGRIHRPRGL